MYYKPVRDPDVAASNVETWKSRKASSICGSNANGDKDIFASDSAMRTIASNCL